MQLLVAQCSNNDNSAAYLSASTLEKLGLFKGDVIKLKSKHYQYAVAIVMVDPNEKEPVIKINSVVRKNLNVQIGDHIEIQLLPNLQYIENLNLLLFEDQIAAPHQSIMEEYLIPYFHDTYRPIMEGDAFTIKGKGQNSIQIKVVSCHPKIGVVTSATVITTQSPGPAQ